MVNDLIRNSGVLGCVEDVAQVLKVEEHKGRVTLDTCVVCFGSWVYVRRICVYPEI